jgi:non-ribosomal peptide synthase protein (TIGR01720 family)
MTLLATFAAFLARLTGGRDFVVGSPASHRPLPETEALLGCFVNSLALRVQLEDDPPFTRILKQVRTTAIAAFGHLDVPFEAVVEALGPARRPGRNPLFQVMFDLHQAPDDHLRLHDLDCHWVELPSATASFEPSLTAWQERGSLMFSLEYDGELFEATTIERWLAALENLLTAVASNQNTALTALPPLTKTEHRQLIEAREDLPQVPLQDIPPQLLGTLVSIWRQVLGVQTLTAEDNFFAHGGDSILVLRLVDRARRAGLKLLPRDVFQNQTPVSLAATLTAALATTLTCAPSTSDSVHAAASPGSVPLTPIQHWFFAWNPHRLEHFNQSILLATRKLISPPTFATAIRLLLQRHDALRLRFHQKEGAWRQSLPALQGAPPATTFDLSALPPGRRPAALEQAAALIQTTLCLRSGPLLRGAFFHFGHRKNSRKNSDDGRLGRVLLVIHHLVVDGVSWPVLVEDLEQALFTDRPIERPATATPFATWARLLARQAHQNPPQEELPYWRQITQDLDYLPKDGPLPLDDLGNRPSTEDTVECELDAITTKHLLQHLPATTGGRLLPALLASLVRAFAPWTGHSTLHLELEDHGRRELLPEADNPPPDLTRTVGWFTATYPVRLKSPPGSSPLATFHAVAENLRQTPQQGFGYGLLRHLDPNPVVRQSLVRLPQPEISFNYLGRVDPLLEGSRLFSAATESPGPEYATSELCSHLFDLNAGLAGGKLFLHWTYNPTHHRRVTVQSLAEKFLGELRNLARQCHRCPPSW